MVRRLLKKQYRILINSGKRVCNFLMPTVRILLYHRVEDVQNDPHELCVGKDNFYNQIKFLKENFKIIPLVKLAQDIRKSRVDNNTIVITFDDGYADNLHNATPILQKFNIPATIFITAGGIGQNLFYWDKDNPEAGHPLSADELKELTKISLIEIGAHTLTHPRLSGLSAKNQEKEISESKKNLEEMINRPVLSFAYPFGGINSFTLETVSMVKKAGYHYACANIHERVTPKSNLYTLPRFIVRDWTVEELKQKMKKWL